MKVLHIVPGLDAVGNGIATAAKLIATRNGDDIVDACKAAGEQIAAADEVWVHSMWTPQVMLACWRALRAGKILVRMPHGNLDPLRCRSRWWKKAVVTPVERALFRRSARVAVTCEEERRWCEAWGVRGKFEVIDLKRFFRLDAPASPQRTSEARPLHVLYLGRRHPLKGIRHLEEAVAEINLSVRKGAADEVPPAVELRVESHLYGAAKDAAWAWCDVLCLPTLSENFGLVVAEALERGKRVITTDGAPAWGGGNDHGGRLVYLKGYREGTDVERVRLLREALLCMANARNML